MEKIITLARDIGQTVSRYYGVLAIALLATAGFIAESANRGSPYSETRQQNSEIYVKLGLLSLMGISLLFALHIAQQRYRIRWPLPILGFLVLAVYYVLLPSANIHQAQPVTVTVLVVSAICFHLLVAIIPFLKPHDMDGFWDYNKTVFINAVQTAVFTIVLWGGLALAVVAVEQLFNIDVPDAFWERLAITVLIMGSSLIFLLFSKEGLAALKIQLPYPTVLRFFVQYILVPLLIIYLVILYSYGIKILVEWDLPKGWVSYLVLAYSSLGILSLLLLSPLSDVVDKVWVNWFSRIFYLTLLPLLVLLFVAIGVRISDYGVTENRYYVLLLALWLLGIAGYHLFGQKNGIKVIPLSLFIVGIFSLLLPFGNVFQVSFNSQSRLLRQLLSEHQVLTADGIIDFDQQVRRTVLREIGSKLHYLNTRNQQKTIRSLVAHGDTAKVDSLLADRSTSEYQFATLFAHVIEDDNLESRYTRLVSGRPTNRVYLISDYDYMIPVAYLTERSEGREYTLGNDSLSLRIGGANPMDTSGAEPIGHQRNTLYIRSTAQAAVLQYDYTASIDSIYARYAKQLFQTYEIEVDDLSTVFQLGDYQVKIHFNEMEFRLPDGDATHPVPRDSLHIYSQVAIFIKK